MKRVLLFFVVLCVLLYTGSVSALTITLDGVLDEWVGSDVVNLGSRSAPDVGSYTMLATWDATNLYLGMDRDSSDRYLGDVDDPQTGHDFPVDSFFVAIDTDGIAASGASSDGYGRMNFGGSMLPDQIYYYAGGSGWHESSTWNGSGWDWNGWTDSGAYYGWQEDNPNDELTVPLANIGGSHEVMVWGWMTREKVGYIEASWPDGYTGDVPTMADGVMIPEPATMTLLGIGSLLLTSVRRKK